MKWIDVNDRLPDRTDTYLVHNESDDYNGECESVEFFYKGSFCESETPESITHWLDYPRFVKDIDGKKHYPRRSVK